MDENSIYKMIKSCLIEHTLWLCWLWPLLVVACDSSKRMFHHNDKERISNIERSSSSKKEEHREDKWGVYFLESKTDFEKKYIRG